MLSALCADVTPRMVSSSMCWTILAPGSGVLAGLERDGLSVPA